MYNVSINLWVILSAAIASQIVGMIWYSPFVLGKPWARLTGMNENWMKDRSPEARKKHVLSFLSSFVMSYVLVLLMSNLVLIDTLQVFKVGFLMWLGFVATTTFSQYLFASSPRPRALYFIDNGYSLISILVMVYIISLFI